MKAIFVVFCNRFRAAEGVEMFWFPPETEVKWMMKYFVHLSKFSDIIAYIEIIILKKINFTNEDIFGNTEPKLFKLNLF